MEATLEAVTREGRGKNEANRLRASGRIPAVVYGTGSGGPTPETVSVAVDPKALSKILHSESGANTLITLSLGGSQSRVMVREYQLDPVTHALLHADFYQLAMDRAITVPVPILVKGDPKGAKLQGGVLDFVTREIQVLCLPTDIPGHIEVDVTELMLHQSIRVRDLVADPKWKPITDGDTMLVHIVMPKAVETTEVAATEVAPAAAAEPEVIKKGKTEEKEEEKKK